MGGKAPSPPDPQETASAQTSQNVSTAVANANLGNVNQITPYGSLTYDKTGSYSWTDMSDPENPVTYDIPQFTATQTLSPEQRALYDINSATEQNIATIGRDQSARIMDLLGNPIDAGDLPDRVAIPDSYGFENYGGGPQLDDRYAVGGDITRTYGTDFSEDRLRVERALMDRMKPYLDREREATASGLANQGLMMGSEGYTRGMDDYSRMANDARLGAILSGGDEQARMVGMEAQRAAFENAAQGQAFGQDRANIDTSNLVNQQMFDNAFRTTGANNALQNQRFAQDAQRYGLADAARSATLNEMFGLRNQPINEISALLSGSQVQSPNFVNTGGAAIPTTDIAGITQNAYNQEMAAYQSDQAFMNNILGGLFGMGGAYLGRP